MIRIKVAITCLFLETRLIEALHDTFFFFLYKKGHEIKRAKYDFSVKNKTLFDNIISGRISKSNL